jgi:hypothetical protein
VSRRGKKDRRDGWGFGEEGKKGMGKRWILVVLVNCSECKFFLYVIPSHCTSLGGKKGGFFLSELLVPRAIGCG